MNWLNVIAENPFYEFAIILFLAALLGGIGQILKQPLIVVFIALGIIVGPSLLNIVQSKENINLLSDIGIAILLFIVGLKLDLRIIKSVGKIALLTGLGQVVFTSIIGYLISIFLGFTSMQSFYIAVALTFSSTIIIVKLLSDKKEIDTLYGQIAIGFLIVQDIIVILVMITLSALGKNSGNNLYQNLFETAAAGLILLLITFIAMKWVIPFISYFLAKSTELLTLFAIAWAVSFASTGELMNFSAEVGAFLAGVTLASSDFKDVISSRLVSLRDFLLLFFFVNLGSELRLEDIGSYAPSAIILSLFVLVGNPIIVLTIMGAMGYRKRTSFLAGLTVAQISEFSLIFAALGLSIGHINEEIVGLITLVGLITIGISTYLIIYSNSIFSFLSPFLSVFQRKNAYRENDLKIKINPNIDVIIIGLGRFGQRITEMLDKHTEINYLGVDYDPVVVKKYRKKNKNILYGDMEDPELLEHLPFLSAKCILSTVIDLQNSNQFVKRLKNEKYSGKIFLTALNEKEAELITAVDKEDILIPYQMAATNFYNSYLLDLLNAPDNELIRDNYLE